MWVLLVNVVGGLLKLCVGLMNVRVRKINVVGVKRLDGVLYKPIHPSSSMQELKRNTKH